MCRLVSHEGLLVKGKGKEQKSPTNDHDNQALHTKSKTQQSAASILISFRTVPARENTKAKVVPPAVPMKIVTTKCKHSEGTSDCDIKLGLKCARKSELQNQDCTKAPQCGQNDSTDQKKLPKWDVQAENRDLHP